MSLSDEWNYRKLHTISGTSDGAQTNYQIKIVTDYGSGADSDNTIYLDGKSKGTFDDIRFTTSDGETELDFFKDDLSISSSADFWVEVDSIPESPSTKDIYIYYGNDSANPSSNIKNTYPQAIDFNADVIGSHGGSQDSGGGNEWSSGSNISIAKDFIHFGLGSYRSNNWKYANVGSLNITSGDFMIEYWISGDTSNEPEIVGCGHDTVASIGSIEAGKSYTCWGTQVWGLTTLMYDEGEADWQYINAVLDDYTGSHDCITMIHDNDTGPSATSTKLGNIRVRKYTSNEPTHGVWGDEEEFDENGEVILVINGSGRLVFGEGNSGRLVVS